MGDTGSAAHRGSHPGAAGQRGASHHRARPGPARRSWLPSSSGSPTAWSWMTIATASGTGGSGWTTSQAARRDLRDSGSGSRTSTPVDGDDPRRPPTALASFFEGYYPAAAVYPTGAALVFGGRATEWKGPRAGRPLLRVGLGDREWSGRGHGLRPRCRVAGSVGRDDAVICRPDQRSLAEVRRAIGIAFAHVGPSVDPPTAPGSLADAIACSTVGTPHVEPGYAHCRLLCRPGTSLKRVAGRATEKARWPSMAMDTLAPSIVRVSRTGRRHGTAADDIESHAGVADDRDAAVGAGEGPDPLGFAAAT